MARVYSLTPFMLRRWWTDAVRLPRCADHRPGRASPGKHHPVTWRARTSHRDHHLGPGAVSGVSPAGYFLESDGCAREAAIFRERSALEALFHVIDPDRAGSWTNQTLRRFTSIATALAARPEQQLAAFEGVRPPAELLRALQNVMEHVLAAPLIDQPLLSNRELLDRYLRASMGGVEVERLRVLYLDAHFRIIRDEVMAEGTIDEVPAHPREIIKRALELGAKSLIVVHNHPRGEAAPSKADKDFTRRLVAGLRFLEIAVADHLVVTSSAVGSFRDLGLL